MCGGPPSRCLGSSREGRPEKSSPLSGVPCLTGSGSWASEPQIWMFLMDGSFISWIWGLYNGCFISWMVYFMEYPFISMDLGVALFYETPHISRDIPYITGGHNPCGMAILTLSTFSVIRCPWGKPAVVLITYPAGHGTAHPKGHGMPPSFMTVTWLVVAANPSEKWWSESQLGLWHSQYDGKNKIPWFQTTNQSYFQALHTRYTREV